MPFLPFLYRKYYYRIETDKGRFVVRINKQEKALLKTIIYAHKKKKRNLD
jgi:hypothetical protein